MLWNHLCNKQLLGIQFYRQKVIGNYVVDFYAAAAKLVIELDGSQHYESNAIIQDQKRDHYLNSLNLTVKRFSNNQVRENINGVLEEIYEHIRCFT